MYEFVKSFLFPIVNVSMVVWIFDSSNTTVSPVTNFEEFKYTISKLFASPPALLATTLAMAFELLPLIFSPITAFVNTPADALNLTLSNVGVVPSTDS